MKTSTLHADISLVQRALCQAGINATIQGTATNQSLQLAYRCNPDGSIRWVFPVAGRHPHFLRFYHRGHWRSVVFVLLVKALFLLRLQRLFIHGCFTLFITAAGHHKLSAGGANQWALFTGTVGPNRKVILWRRNKNGKGSFTKIAITPLAVKNLAIERKALTLFNADAMPLVQLPIAKAGPESFLTQTDVVTKATRRTNRITALPAAALQQWLCAGKQLAVIANTHFYTATQASLIAVAAADDHRIPATLLNKLQTLKGTIQPGDITPVTTSHGDCTPWNVFYANDKLLLIDWELSAAGMPALYDLFHFVYQSNILIGNRGYKAIRKELDALFSQPEWKSFLHQQQWDAVELEKQYLTYTAAYYLNIYCSQPGWHMQVQWLLATWTDAATYHLYKAEAAAARKLLLADVKTYLQPIRYAVLKLADADLSDLPDTSDIDICIRKSEAVKLYRQLQQHPLVTKINTTSRSHMMQLTLVISDGSLLHIDFIWHLKRKALCFIPAEELLATATPNAANTLVPSAAMDFLYTWLFYFLNNAPVPDRYRQHYNKLPQAAKQELDEVVQAYLPAITLFEEVCAPNKTYRQMVVKSLKRLSENKGLAGFANQLWYGLDTLRNSLPRKGCVITFSGVDGAGKSTIIEKTKTHIEKCLRGKVVVIRHRPSVLPILSAYKYGKQQAEQKAANTLPRQGSNGGVGSSLARFAYYYTDYALGQFYVQVRYVWRGYTVLYDRYYFDFINDSKRSNINLPKAFTSWCYRFLLKPKLNFFLYAQPEEILKRKKELDAATIILLTKAYLQLFHRLAKKYNHSKYLPVHNIDLTTTLDIIFQNIKTTRS